MTEQIPFNHGSVGKSLHTNNPKYEVIVYNISKDGVMAAIKFEDLQGAKLFYDSAIEKGFHATLIEL